MKTAKNKAVRNLRNIIAKTQSEFAAMVGVSKDTVVSWENGRNKLAKHSAKRIHRVTGAVAEDLIKGRPQVRYCNQSFDLEIYDSNHFKSWTEIYKTNEDVADAMFEIANQELRLIFLAAAKPHNKIKGRLHAVHESFIGWMKETVASFKLDGAEMDLMLKRFPLGPPVFFQISPEYQLGGFGIPIQNFNCIKPRNGSKQTISAPQPA